MKDKDIKILSDEELERNLITSDFRGRDFKKQCLEEIKRRERNKVYEEGKKESDTLFGKLIMCEGK